MFMHRYSTCIHTQLMQAQAAAVVVTARKREGEAIEEMSSPMVTDGNDAIRGELFRRAMRGEWQEVVKIYKKDPKAYLIKIDKSGDTALHIAVSDGQEAIVEELVDVMSMGNPEEAKKALWVANEKDKNTPLHVAASLGSVRMCHCIAKVDPSLVGARNSDNETPLFLAVRQGEKQVFLCLQQICGLGGQYYRNGEGDTILHVAIGGEYLDLAFQIIHLYKELVNSVNVRGVTPLHILASKPTIFESSSCIKGYSWIIYQCTFVDELKVDKPDTFCADVSRGTTESAYPKNCETCMYLFSLVWRAIKVVFKSTECCPVDAENPRGTPGQYAGQLIPPSYNTCFDFVKFVSKAMLVILGLGSSDVKKVREEKEKHAWSAQIMNELLKGSKLYEYDNSGRSPHGIFTKDGATDESKSSQDNTTTGMSDLKDDGKSAGEQETHETGKQETASLMTLKNSLSDDIVEKILTLFPLGDVNLDRKNIVLTATEKPEMPVVETPILIAAKNGIAEMVEKILESFPVAIHDKNAEKKNLVLLAVEHRQPHVYELLLNRNEGKDTDSTKVKDVVFRQVDDKGNSALHLAAVFGDSKPWLIPGAALQMQWEIKWYEFVMESTPKHFSVQHNKAGKTPMEIFTDTHKELVQNGSKWLTNTSTSCSVVAALIATVSFTTSATIPGGFDQSHGTPILASHQAFNVFAVSSLVALCFSVTSVVMFLAILTSRYEEKDFRRDLPGKLLIGLSSLFLSITAVLVSFCAGHFFVLKHKLRYAAFPVYMVTCLPVTFFAIAQFPLYFDVVRATIKKVPQRSCLVIPAGK